MDTNWYSSSASSRCRWSPLPASLSYRSRHTPSTMKASEYF